MGFKKYSQIWAGIFAILFGILAIIQKEFSIRGGSVAGDGAVACGVLMIIAGLMLIGIYFKHKKKQPEE